MLRGKFQGQVLRINFKVKFKFIDWFYVQFDGLGLSVDLSFKF